MIKSCFTCGLSKNETEFSWKVRNIKRSGVCKDCHRDYRKKHYQKNQQKYKDKARSWEESQGGKVKIRYGISTEQLNIMIARYDGMCWLCRQKPWTCIDHDHRCCDTGNKTCGNCVRGLLCVSCNVGLGQLGDSIKGLEAATDYLQSYECRKH